MLLNGKRLGNLSAIEAIPDQEIMATVNAVAETLTPEGNSVVRIAVHPDAKWVDKLRRARVDLVFNLCESIDGVAALEPPVISVRRQRQRNGRRRLGDSLRILVPGLSMRRTKPSSGSIQRR